MKEKAHTLKCDLNEADARILVGSLGAMLDFGAHGKFTIHAGDTDVTITHSHLSDGDFGYYRIFHMDIYETVPAIEPPLDTYPADKLNGRVRVWIGRIQRWLFE